MIVYHKVVRIDTGQDRLRIEAGSKERGGFTKAERAALIKLDDLIDVGNLAEAIAFRRSWDDDKKMKKLGEYVGMDIHDFLWDAAMGSQYQFVGKIKPEKYEIHRNAARGIEAWRMVARIAGRKQAIARFKKEKAKAKQGELRMVNTEGDIEFYSAPRV